MGSSLTSPVLVDGVDIMSGVLIPGVAQRHIVTRATTTDETFKYWSQNTDPVFHHTTVATALAACTSGRNDLVMLSPDLHTTAATITWSKNMTHLIGMYGPAMLNMRSRITHSVTVDPLINITGYGCTFANLYTMYGMANATDLTCLKVTGNRNSFIHCHFLLQAAEPADVATFKMLHLTETDGGDGLEHYFNHTTISAEAIAMTIGTFIKTAGTPRLVFEDCLFVMRSDAVDPTFINGTAGDGQGFVIFKNCTGINLGTAITYAIGSTGIAAATDYIIHNSGFTGCTDLIAAADEAKVIGIAQVGNATDDVNIGLGLAYDHTA